ncbi:MAG: cell division protein ZapB [Acidobacteriota bacterium]|nr:MAG: cell division protein ZapB [Acidobacteriota bacterium]
MNALTGMEKFSHLEDKIYLTIEHSKKLREERDRLEQEVLALRAVAADAITDKEEAERRLRLLLDEREAVRKRVNSVIDAFSVVNAAKQTSEAV